MHKTLIVTNDFPPRPGGIQAFVHNMAVRQPAGSIVVYASTWRDGSEVAKFDAEQPFPVIRDRTKMMVPTPRVTRRAAEILRAEGCDSVWFGAAAPLGLMAPALRRAGAGRLLGMTHGHEAAWAQLPVARQLLRRIGAGTDTLTYLGEYTRSRIAAAVGPEAAARMVQLPPGVDEQTFRPDSGGAEIRARLGLTDRPVVVCVSRLVPRKGQDTLIAALPQILRDVPDAVLLIVGGGPYQGELEKLAEATGVSASVRFTGAVPWSELPAHYGAGDVFAMPCRTRRGGLDVEGLGIVYLEASATGLPVIAGDSGGAPDAVLEGETGYVVPGGSPEAVAERTVRLLHDPELRRTMGEAGRRWVERSWRWDLLAGRLTALLAAE
ncbi:MULTISPECIES: glycosyltransferase family 4 protein [unclassified Kitasatospora]|uniref:glycosyltransferase family 4 protein n=1 Tax=unclassified Kitasatospora TaxID=2633591 RepID=UPI000709404F|nr:MULTISPECIES: glycosyltransferase family 4 protein [unclassified Kitasatospora]KQV16844.1 alpha-(1-2)-phosphatidylinositol mannosyltransferase [Kitasatospora sp. Root107]KRB73710.1 alpha-(1-2)-phosphatidylinositol mannosyltransferase [Kitasatospora sp. Root187]